jgi:asparagine synthase (glutamine-hydrolysing)
MCGIAGIIDLTGSAVDNLENRLAHMSRLIEHRGPDDQGIWMGPRRAVGFAHRRLSIIDLSAGARQPMVGENNSVLTYNGEIYNYLELMDELSDSWQFKTHSDSEVILAAFAKYGIDCLQKLRGMFAFAVWDGQTLLCARDRFGIKPFYYAQVGDRLYFASEAKALIPFLDNVEPNVQALSEYFTFQYSVSDQTLFQGIKQLMPGHYLTIKNGRVVTERYWDVHYDIDYDHSPEYFNRHLEELIDDSVNVHLRSDVDVGCYLSGGVDSSLISALANQKQDISTKMFHGRFTYSDSYDESYYAKIAAKETGGDLQMIDINSQDFIDSIHKVIYHLDYPVAGPGSFPQYMVSKLASQHVKVVLGGQGGDEIFGGYARYVIAYFEQCIRAAMDGSYKNGNFVVTPESIIPNLNVLKEYQPLMKQFWKEGLFEDIDKRYLRLIDRSADVKNEVRWDMLDSEHVYQQFDSIFNSTRNVRKEAYFDSMTHFDFKCLLPALLQVEDRVSMAHGLEARVPMLDHKLVEFVATIPADVKFKGGRMKCLLKNAYKDVIPKQILDRRDKMGFPVPLNEWMQGELKDFVLDIFNTGKARNRPFIDYSAVIAEIEKTAKFSRKLWAFLSLELWHQQYCDKIARFETKATSAELEAVVD